MATTSVTSSSNIETLVQQYMATERQPLTRLQTQKYATNAKITHFNTLKADLESLSSIAEDLSDTDGDSIFNAASVTSSNTDAVSVSADEGAAVGTYSLRVKQLATSTTMKSTANLNTAVSVKSNSQVVAGLDELDTSESWEDAGFDTVPTGNVTFNGVQFTLGDYETIDDFLDAVNDDAVANVNIYYDKDSDKFIIENDGIGGTLILAESSDGFLTQINVTAGTYNTNTSGVQTDVLLKDANFDNEIATGTTGSFKINGITIDWDADADTLNEIISRINASEANVTVFYDESLDKVMITSNDTGSESIQFEDVDGSFLGDSLKLSGVVQNIGQDAKFTVNSADSSDEITKTSNTFELNGLSITLSEVTVENDNYADSGTEAVTVTSVKDINAIQNQVQSFLNGFNEALSFIKNKTSVDPTTYTRGALAGETVYRNLRFDLMNIFVGQVDGLDDGDVKTLAEVGITLDDDLKATISDTDLLTEQLSSDPNAFEALFNSTNGIATRMFDLLEPFIEDDGIIENRQENIEDHVDSIDKSIERTEARLAKREEYYRQQLQSVQIMLNQVVQQQKLMNSILSSTQQLF